MAFNRANADAELSRDFLVAESSRDKIADLLLLRS